MPCHRPLDDQRQTLTITMSLSCTLVPIPLVMKAKGFEATGTAFVEWLSSEYQEA